MSAFYGVLVSATRLVAVEVEDGEAEPESVALTVAMQIDGPNGGWDGAQIDARNLTERDIEMADEVMRL